MSMSKYTFDSVMDDVQLLISRMRAREEVADALRQQASKLQSQLLSMRQCREETLGFEEFSKCALTHPKGQLLVCLAAENKQLEQLRIENKTLRNSLDEHNTALDMIMSKYRGQISKLMRTSEVEQIFQSIMNPDSSQASHKKISKYDPSCPHSSVLAKQPTDSVVSQPVLRKPKSNTDSVDGSRKVEESGNGLVQSLTQQLNTVVSVVREVTDQGDVYAAELEEELHRLRSENAGLRELLMISSDCCPDTNLGNSTLLPPVSLPKKVSIQDESSLPEPPGRFIFLREDPSSIRSSRMDESLNSLEVNGNSLFYDAPSDNGGDAGVCNIDSDNHSNVDSGDEDVTVYGSSDESQAS
ncbi:unnamed protein product [Heterobilharzia americana]|nr:unnamed protein product [Heterobilharzia americana]